ncbi:MAG: diguanylate cyclase [Acidobacteria bacterium]|nr:diguanylate cyclase [Acidobacteriota bacterium]
MRDASAEVPRSPLAVVVSANGSVSWRADRLDALKRRFPEAPILVAGGKAKRSPRGGDGRLELPLRATELEEAARRHRCLVIQERRQRRRRENERCAQDKLKVLQDIARKAYSSLDPDKVIEIVARAVCGLVRARHAIVYRLQEDRHTLVPSNLFGPTSARKCNFTLRVGEGVAGRVVQRRRAQRLTGAELERVNAEGVDSQMGLRTRSILAVPLNSRGRIIGALELRDRRGSGPFTAADQAAAMEVAEPAAVAIDTAFLFKRCQELSVLDDLTQLYNSRYMREVLARELKRASRYGSSVSLIFIDLDGFKSVNDHHGHLIGSRTLIEIAQVLREAVREIDVVSRYGGDEFTVVLPHTGRQGARVIAERIRTAIEGRVFMQEDGLIVRLTASLGVACFPNPCRTAETLIQRSDQSMYDVKADGGNAVQVAT